MQVNCCGHDCPTVGRRFIGPEKEPLEGASVQECQVCHRTYDVWVRRIVVHPAKEATK